MNILGISCFYHDSAACLLKDGKVVAAAEEERFSRIKHDNSFPENSIKYCLAEGKINPKNLDFVGFYEKPIIKFDRILQTAIETFPSSFSFFHRAIPTWMNEKLRMKHLIKKKVGFEGKILFIDHHTSHASSCFFVSPFKKAAIMTVDGLGEWKTTGLYLGNQNKIVPLKEINFPDSLGLLYAAVTAFLGFRVNHDEYKVMGLAAYGKPKYLKKFRKLIDIRDDGSFKINMDYFSYRTGEKMWSKKFEKLFGRSRTADSKIKKRHENIAATLQKITEEAYFKIANHLYDITKEENLCLAGGVALNSVANGKLFTETPFKHIFIQPAAGDSGGAIGVVTYIYNQILGKQKIPSQEHSFLGPEFSDSDIESFLKRNKIKFEKLSTSQILETTANLIKNNKIVGWFQGKMEWGPRALGNRSILANPINAEMKDIINNKVKHREDFRPFAGSILQEKVHEYFDVPEENHWSPFMLFVFDVKEEMKNKILAITHVDGTCRIQTVQRKDNPKYYDLIKKFENITDVPVILNTSFNRKGEAIVCTPQEAYNCFMGTQIDYLVMNNFLVSK